MITVLRIANRTAQRKKGKIASIPEAVEILSPEGVETLAARTATFDFFERTPGWDVMPERFRLHAVATQAAADRLARELDCEDRDELLCSALLHDVGKLVLTHAYPGYPVQVHQDARTPEERIHRERLELGVDHALVGGVLARRWALPNRLATAIERHHADDAEGEAALVGLRTCSPTTGTLSRSTPRRCSRPPARSTSPPSSFARSCTSCRRARATPSATSIRARSRPVRSRCSSAWPRARSTSRSPTSSELSTSTVRTHLHNTYAKLGAVDRAQAVLIATERGWI